MSCDFADCALDAAERRGMLRLCPRHAREHDELTGDAAILCALCPLDAEYTIGGEELCRACADNAMSCGPAPRLVPVPTLTIVDRVACDYDDCPLAATERRDAQQFCGEHAREHDELLESILAHQAATRAQRLATLTKHLEAAQAAMVAWFVDSAWLVYLEVSPRGLGLRLERSAMSLASVTLRADSDVRALAEQLVDAVEEVAS